MTMQFEISISGIKSFVPFWAVLDMRKTFVLMLDTETLCAKDVKDISDGSLVYDIGFSLIDTTSHVCYYKRSLVIKETFTYEFFSQMRQTAYYAEKFPQYWADIKAGKRSLVSFWEAWAEIRGILKTSGAIVCAHNARFDVKSLNNTIRLLSCGRIRYFFPYGTVIWDTLKMCRDVLSKRPTYVKFCDENGYRTKRNQLRYTAEIVYRYITSDNDFVESHTGLEDVEIETEILRFLLKQHKPMRKELYQKEFSGIPASFKPFDPDADYCQP